MNTPVGKKRKPSLYLCMQILGGVIAIIVFVVVVRIHSTEANVSIEGEEIRIEGSYGERFSLDDLSQVNLVDTLPVIKSRTDGYSFASVKKGYFRTESGERIKLFLHVADGPFLKIQRKDDIPVFINYSDSSKTQQVYKEILAQINK